MALQEPAGKGKGKSIQRSTLCKGRNQSRTGVRCWDPCFRSVIYVDPSAHLPSHLSIHPSAQPFEQPTTPSPAAIH